MKNSLCKFLLPASALAVLATFAQPALRADEPAAPTFGALSDPASSGVAPAAKDAGSDAAQTGLNKKGKKKHGKKKHGKKAKDAATSADQAAVSTAPAAAAAK
jgi:hypothetical protein